MSSANPNLAQSITESGASAAKSRSHMPPLKATTPRQASSLWQTGSHSFFPDPRASHVGDIITVDITIADSGQISNTTTRSRNNSDSANLTNFFGLENSGLLRGRQGGARQHGNSTTC